MKTCRYKNKIVDILYDELSADEKIDFKRHAENCLYCSEQLHQFMATKKVLFKKKRPAPNKNLLYTYHHNLKQIYNDNAFNYSWILQIFNKVLVKPSYTVRLVEAAAIFIIGITIGIYVNDSRTINPVQTPIQSPSAQTKMLENVLSSAEVLLLDVSNLENVNDLKYILENNNCARLLQKTSILKDQARDMNDIRLINLLDQIEFILLDLANCDGEISTEELNFIKETIKDFHLFVELKVIGAI